MFKAIREIGGYQVGDIVPDEKAIVWAKMYATPHVQEVKDEKEEVEENMEKSGILDDYLARNKNVVIKNLKSDEISLEQLEEMLILEKAGKKRKQVIKVLEERLGEEQ